MGVLMRRPRLRGMRLGLSVCCGQLLLGLIMAGLFAWESSAQAAAAAIFGAILAAVPGLFMALMVLPSRPSSDARHRARLLMLGQLGKWILTGGLFVAAILVFGRNLGPLLITYAVCLSCYWLGLMITR